MMKKKATKKKKDTAGDVYAIETNIGYGFIQCVAKDDDGIDFVRVLEPILENVSDFDENFCLIKERYWIQMLIAPAKRAKLIDYVGNFVLPIDAKVPTKCRHLEKVPHRNIRDWYLVDVKTWQHTYVENPDEEFFKLSDLGVWNAAF